MDPVSRELLPNLLTRMEQISLLKSYCLRPILLVDETIVRRHYPKFASG
jgi:hypothetical protein